jgi:hypothetical protein
LSFISSKENLLFDNEKSEIKLLKVYKEFDGYQCNAVQQTSDGGYMIAGVTCYNNYTGYDGLFIKTDATGKQIWNRTYGTKRSDWIEFGEQTSDGGYIFTGTSPSNNSIVSSDFDFYDLWVIKTNNIGDVEWEKRIGGDLFEEGWTIHETSDGNYVIVGCGDSYGANKTDILILKINPFGSIIWNITFGGPYWDSGFLFQETLDNGYIVLGSIDRLGDGSKDILLLKITKNGTIEWNRTFGGKEHDYARSIKQTFDGGYIITGLTNSFGSSGEHIWLIKVNEYGIEEWNKTIEVIIYFPKNEGWNDTFMGLGRSEGIFVKQTSDGGYIILAEIQGDFRRGFNYSLIKTNETGKIQWNKSYESKMYGYLNIAETTSDGGYIIGGAMWAGEIHEKLYLIKTDFEGNYNLNGILLSKNLLDGLSAYSIKSFKYNTFIPNGTSIKFQFSQNNLTWYDSNGNLNQWSELISGEHSINLNQLNIFGTNFYYRMNFSSNDKDIPILRNIKVTFTEKQDKDKDGYFDDWEIFLGTNPEDLNDHPLDNDNDKIPDGDSNNSESWMDNDDDNDGLSDNWELEFNFNPLNSADANFDNDNDGFTNLEEFQADTDPLDPDDNPNNKKDKKNKSRMQDYNFYFIMITIILLFLFLLAILMNFRNKRRRPQW